MGQQPFQLGGSQGGGRAAADVDGADRRPRLGKQRGHSVDLPVQGVQKRLYQLQRPLHISGDKRAVGAPGGAEGDADVKAQLLGPEGPLDLQSGLGRLQRQICPLRGDKVFVQKPLSGLLLAQSLLQRPGGQLGRANTGECAPVRPLGQQLDGSLVKGLLENALQKPVIDERIGGIRRGNLSGSADGPSPMADGGLGGCGSVSHRQHRAAGVFLPLKGSLGILRPLLRKEDQHDLLYGILIVMSL